MSNKDGKVCRLCRIPGKKLFLKGMRCNSPKCPLQTQSATNTKTIVRAKTSRRRRPTDYGLQLREKQSLKYQYGVDERTLRGYFGKARKTKLATGEVMIQLLESRLDNVVYRLGFAVTRQMARQIVGHRHVTVDGRLVNIPSFQVRPGSVIALDTTAINITEVHKLITDKDFNLPEWLERKAAVGKFTRQPKRDEIDIDINDQIIVEFYSR